VAGRGGLEPAAWDFVARREVRRRLLERVKGFGGFAARQAGTTGKSGKNRQERKIADHPHRGQTGIAASPCPELDFIPGAPLSAGALPTIRPYQEGDLPALIALVRELQAHELALYDLMKQPAEIGAWYFENFAARCAKEVGFILVAEDAERVLGYATLLTSVEEDGTGDEVAHIFAEIADLVVTHEARGKGVGKLLLEECEKRARAAGRELLRIGVLAKNVRAHLVYETFGFTDHHVTMSKKLG
jgi:GNAT superfamily N-acetyltransferase